MLDALQSSTLVKALTGLLDDVGLLLRQEVQLAKTEIAIAAAAQVRTAGYFLASAVLGFVALLLICQSAIFTLIYVGVPAPWACLLVTAFVAMLAMAAFLIARAALARPSMPNRTFIQIRRDVAAVKESLS